MMEIPLWVARHEAGHAVAAEYLGARCREVRIGRQNGMTRVRFSGRLDPIVAGIIACAGHAANVKWDRRSKATLPTDDFNITRMLGFRGRSLRTIALHARGVVDEIAPAVQLVARRLKERRKMNRRELRRLMREAGVEPGSGN